MYVDFVILWVDGNDPAWRKEKEKYTGEKTQDTENRYRDWGLLKYWFRAVEKYAPWVRLVHFVTWGHLPDFLDTKCDKLNIVNHREFLPEEYLPCYNSAAIELNLHRIPEITEHFVYFNDDMFLTRPVEQSDFFDKNGNPRMQFWEMPIRSHGAGDIWQFSSLNDMGAINRNFNKRGKKLTAYPGKYLSAKYPPVVNIRNMFCKLLFPEYYVGFKNYHTYAPLLKNTFREVWDKEPELLQNVTSHRFRSPDDVNQWLLLWWQMAKGAFSPIKNDTAYYSADAGNVEEICRDISELRHMSICINDASPDDSYISIAERIRESFEKVLPDKCSFELL